MKKLSTQESLNANKIVNVLRDVATNLDFVIVAHEMVSANKDQWGLSYPEKPGPTLDVYDQEMIALFARATFSRAANELTTILWPHNAKSPKKRELNVYSLIDEDAESKLKKLRAKAIGVRNTRDYSAAHTNENMRNPGTGNSMPLKESIENIEEALTNLGPFICRELGFSEDEWKSTIPLDRHTNIIRMLQKEENSRL